MDGRQDGVPKIVERFCEKYSMYSKRQVELKLNELAVKEKRGTDNRAMWYIRPDYEHFQLKQSDPDQIKRDLNLATNPQILLEVNQDAATSSSSAPATSAKTPKKEKAAAEVSTNSEKKKTPGTAGAKRKASEITSPTTPATQSEAQTSSSSAPEPKKSKRAFAFFVKDMRSEAEKKLVGTADEKVSHILP
jgi:hypothetical protein